MDGMGGWWMGAGTLVFIILIVLVVLGFARQSEEPRGRGTSSSATDILAERFARGEIDEAEYKSRLQALRR